MAIKRPSYRTNEWIRSAELTVIDEDGKQLGVMATRAALEAARSKGLDLVEVAPSAQPPVARIINYKRWLFEREKIRGLSETLKEFGKMEKDPVRAERGYEVTLLPIKRTARDASSTIPRE